MTAPRSRPALGTTPRVARVLVIDDEPGIGAVLRSALADVCEVTFTASSTVGLSWLTSGDWYDVILCDVQMPELDGHEIWSRLYAVNPKLAARIVFMTGGLLDPNVQEQFAGVPNVMIAKPFDVDALRELIRRRTAPQTTASRASGS
jgi:CheY-like chemotaxis protein